MPAGELLLIILSSVTHLINGEGVRFVINELGSYVNCSQFLSFTFCDPHLASQSVFWFDFSFLVLGEYALFRRWVGVNLFHIESSFFLYYPGTIAPIFL